MGILDQFLNMNPEQTNGLLAAASQILQNSGDPRRPFTMGQAMGVGLQAYDSSAEQARQRKLQEEEAKQIAQMRAMQMQEMQGGLQDRDAKREQAMRMIALQQKFAQRGQPQEGMPQAGAASPDGSPGAATQMQAPQMQMPQAPQGPYEKAIAYAQFLESEGQVEQALEVAREAQKLKPKYSTTPHTMRAKDGTLRNLQLAEDGSPPVDVGYGVKPEMKEMRLGDRIEFADLNQVQNGQQFKVGLDPDTVYSGGITMRGQNMTDARARDFNAMSQDANALKREEQQQTKDTAKAVQVAGFDTMLNTLDRLGKHDGLKRSVGVYSKLPTMPGSESANFQAELETFKSQAFIPMVSQLKGMGALSNAEGNKLTAAVGALDPNMGEKAFRASIARITNDMVQARTRVAGPAAGQQAKPGRKSVLKGQVIDGYRFKGGDPSQQSNWEKI